MSTATRRIGISALAIAALGASFAAGAAWDDDGNPRGRIVAAPERLPVVPQGPGTLVRVGGCADLLDWYVDNTVDQVTPWGWNGGWGYFDGIRRDGVLLSDNLAGVPDAAGSAPFAAEDRAAEQSSSATGTNVQESGVDEPDVVKTNGELLVRIKGDDLTTYDVSGAKVRKLSTIDLPGTTDDSAELLLIGDEVVVLSQEAQRWDQQTTRTTVRRVDLSDPEEPEVLDDEQSYDAALISARQYGDTVRLVLGTGLPALDFVQPNDKRSEREALKENQRIVRESEIEDWLPSVREGGGDSELAVGCDSMSRPEDFAGGGSVVVIGYDAGSPSERSSLGVATSSSIVYSSADRLYLATSPMWATCCVIMEDWGGRIAPDFQEDDGTTSLHAFELAGTDATYIGSGEIEGAVRDRWSMDAVDGTLRVAVGATSQTGNFNSIITLREKDGALDEIGRLDRLGVNEQIKSVRWFDDLAFVVTFRQIDPLYAIDLSNPARPRKLAALKIPGFSEYLHPIGDDLMIGIGTDASRFGMTRGGQAAVFDISDLTSLRRVATHGYGRNRQTMAGSDPRQFTWLPERRTALTVVSEWGRDGGASGLVSVLEVGEDGELTTRMLPGTYGYDDVAHLRTVPLPDGRVVLATENGARFLTW